MASSESASLKRIRDSILANIEEAMANPKPTYSIDGQSVSWNQYRDSLFKNLDDINKRMIESEPFEIVTQANNGFGTKNCRRF